VDWPALARRVWRDPAPGVRALRLLLLGPAALYRAGVAARNAAYDAGLAPSRELPRPSLGIGNLAVGGTGKTPLAAHLAGELGRRGWRPGVLLRGYAGGDEAEEHRGRTPGAVVVADPDRRRGAARAVAAGAEVLVLDDCLQRRDLRLDALLAVVAAETAGGPMWPLPAGPWREGLGALGRCDGVVVTFKAAPAALAERIAVALAPRTRGRWGATAALSIARLVPLGGGAPLAPGWLEGRAVVALSGIGEPATFEAQLASLGARVRPLAHGDHHAFTAADAAAAHTLAGPDGVIVTTSKDAVRLRPVWPAASRPCLIAELEVEVTFGRDEISRLLDRLGRAAHGTTPSTAATAPRDGRTSP
jgi:tetraacyldisaccharide 4'-kinase